MEIKKLRELRGYLSYCGLDSQLNRLAGEFEQQECLAVFREQVPPELAQNSMLLLFRTGELCVYTSHSNWASWLRSRQQRLVLAFKSRDLRVFRLKIVTTPLLAPRAGRQVDKPLKPPPAAAKVVLKTSEGISDPALKASLERLARRLDKSS